jgi:hypothetical protein
MATRRLRPTAKQEKPTDRASRTSDLIKCCEVLARELSRLDDEHRPVIDQHIIDLAEANGVDVQCLRRNGIWKSSLASTSPAIDTVRAAIGVRGAIRFGPKRGLTTVTFERVTEGICRVKMPGFSAVFKDGRWYRGPGVLKVGAMVQSDEVATRVAAVLDALKHDELIVLDPGDLSPDSRGESCQSGTQREDSRT